MTKTPRPLLALLLFPLLLALPLPAEAAVNAFWKELGGSATGGAVSQLVPPRGLGNGVGVAAGNDGRPIVIYTDSTSGEDGRILAKRWTGTAWQMLSPAAGINDPSIGGEEPRIVISSSGALFAAWSTREPGGNQVHLRRRAATGTVWEQLGGSDLPGGLTGINGSFVNSFSLAVGDDDLPVVAFAVPAQKPGIGFRVPGNVTGQLQVYVKKYMGAAQGWQYLGSDPFGSGNTSAGGASEAISFIVAGASYAQHAAHGPSLVIDSAGRPTVAFVYETTYPFAGAPVEFVQGNSEIFVTRFENDVWGPVGPGVPSGDSLAGRGGAGGVSNNPLPSQEVSLAGASNGVLWMTWREGASPTAIFVRRWNGTDTWEEVNGSASGNGIDSDVGNAGPRVGVDANDLPIVMWQNFGGSHVVFALRFNGTDWEEMGPDSASGDGITGPGMYRMALGVSSGAGPSTVNVAWLGSTVGPAQARLRQFFTGPSFLLSVGINPSGSGQVVSTPIGIFCPDDSCSEFFPTGQVVSLTAIAGPDALFDKWTGACTGNAACNVSMTAARSVNASFVSASTLTVARTGLGTVTGTGIACGAHCAQKYRSGTLVTLTATMPAGTLFAGWGDACGFRGTNTTCTLTMPSNTSVTATFTQRVYGLGVTNATPPGTVGQGVVGNIIGSGGGANSIGCSFGGSGTCSAGVDHGTRVILSASPAAGNRFLNWTGAPCAGRTNATCDFSMLGNYSVTALFRGITAISVGKGGNGAGVVTGPLINCGTDCLGEAFTNTSVTLRATPAVGSVLDPSGGVCTWTAGACTFTAAGLNQSAIATFTLRKHLLTVTGEGFGYTTSGDGGMDRGSVPGHSDCTELYDYGTLVALTPFAGTDSMFVSWTGCSRLNGSTCLVDMTANRTVHKKFVAARTLTVDASGNGGGRISAPLTPPLTCISNCSVSRLVTAGTSVVLTGRPATGSNLHWSGSGDICTGSGPCTALMSANHSAVGQFTLNRHSLLLTNRPNGSVTGSFPAPDLADIACGSGDNLCSTVQNYGTLVHLQAAADIANVFVNWTGTSPCSVGARATNASCAFPLQGNVTVIPNFRARTVVTVVKDGNGAGTITGPGINCGSDCSDPEFDGKPVTLTATPAVGSRIVAFGGACASNSSTCTFIPAGDNQTVTATFTLRQFVVSVANDANGHVSNPFAMADDIDCGGGIGSDCTATLDYNTLVTLQADPDPVHVFVKWTGTVCANSTNSSCTFKVPLGNVSLAPSYRLRTNVIVMKDGNGSGTVVSTPAGVNCLPNQFQCSADFFGGTPVTLRATPATGSRLVGFSEACTSSNTSTCTFTPVGEVQTVHVELALLQLALTVTSRNQGVVTSIPGVINCGVGFTPCTDTLDYNTPVLLEASPEPGFAFVNWTGTACSGSTNPVCQFTLKANTSVTPNYRRRTVVTVQRDGEGTGTVTGTGIACGIDCTETIFDGKTLTLTAVPATGSSFTRWFGPCSGFNTSVCTFTPTGDQQIVTVEFARQPQLLTVNVNGPGAANGVAPPCNAGTSPCSYARFFGDQVVLQAAPDAGARFISWTGCTTVAGPSCTVLVNANKSVTATFQPEFALVVAPSGNATGRVTGQGIDCGSDCSETYLSGTVVTLTRTLPVGATFQWQDDCAFRAANTSCTLTMDQNRSVGAQFQLQQFTVTVNKTATGQGRIIGLGTTCDLAQPTCSATIDYGTPVTLTADVTGSGSTFDGWSGGSCMGTGSCAFTVSANRTVSAAFNLTGAATVRVGQNSSRTFSANSVTITAGETVRWEWDSGSHNVVSGTNPAPDNQFCSPGDTNCATTPLAGAGTVYTHTFTAPGTYPYFCRQHGSGGMMGTVVVNPSQ